MLRAPMNIFDPLGILRFLILKSNLVIRIIVDKPIHIDDFAK